MEPFKMGQIIRIKPEEVRVKKYLGDDFLLEDTKKEYTGRKPFLWPINAPPFSMALERFPETYFVDTSLKRTDNYLRYHIREETPPSEDEPPWKMINKYYIVKKTKNFEDNGCYLVFESIPARSEEDIMSTSPQLVRYTRDTNPVEHLHSCCHNLVTSEWSGSVFTGILSRIMLKPKDNKKPPTFFKEINEQEIIEFERAGYRIKVLIFSNNVLISNDINLFTNI